MTTKEYVEKLIEELRIARDVCITPTEKAFVSARLVDLQKVLSFIIKEENNVSTE